MLGKTPVPEYFSLQIATAFDRSAPVTSTSTRGESIMKSIVAVLALSLGFVLCNLSGWSNKNANRTSGTIEDTRGPQSQVPLTSEAPPPPPPSLNTNSGTKKITAPISGGVLNGKAISLPQPAYPAIAKAAHASGAVSVEVIVDEEGKVLTAHAVSGHPLLQASAVAAARQARFTPTKLSGQPVKITGVIIYNFVAQ
jgi:TonB family protein